MWAGVVGGAEVAEVGNGGVVAAYGMEVAEIGVEVDGMEVGGMDLGGSGGGAEVAEEDAVRVAEVYW